MSFNPLGDPQAVEGRDAVPTHEIICQYCDEPGTPDKPVRVQEDADREFWMGRACLDVMHDDCYEAQISSQETDYEIGGPFRSDTSHYGD